MTRRGPFLAVLLLAAVAAVPVTANQTVLAISKIADFLYVIDPSLGTILTDLELSGTNLRSGFTLGLAVSPVTGEVFSVLRFDNPDGDNHPLLVIDPVSGVATEIGSTGGSGNLKFADLSFGTDGTLYGVTGDGSPTSPSSLFIIDTSTGFATLKFALGNGDDGEAIAFNPEDGLIYHFSGFGDLIFESVDATTGATTAIPLSGPDGNNFQEVLSMTYAGNSSFYTVDRAGNVTVVSTAGVATTSGDLGNLAKGIAVMRPIALCLDQEEVADSQCLADASVDAGSFDPDGDSVTLTQSPASPYGLGVSDVTLSVSDGDVSTSCEAKVTVVDLAPPDVECGLPASLGPPDTPVVIQATAEDNCSATATVGPVDCYKLNGAGKRIDANDSCSVVSSGDTVTILNTGGVGTVLEWEATAEDSSGNTATETCSIEVSNPGKGKK